MTDIDYRSFKKTTDNIYKFIDDIPCLDNGTFTPAARKILAIGDIHGDFEALIYLLNSSGVIDKKGKWIGRDTTIVQTGDIFDDCRPYPENPSGSRCYNDYPVQGYDEIIILDFLADLNQQAERTGGRVIICMGNHEYINITKPSMYKEYIQPATREYFKERRAQLLKPGGRLAKKLSCMVNVVAFVGDWVFLHGGLRPSAFEDIDDIRVANIGMRALLRGELTPSDADEFLKEANDPNWFFWDRAYSQNMVEEDGSRLCNEFIQIRHLLGKPNLRMVIGHTTQHRINSICHIDGKPAIYRIDTSMGRTFGPKSHPGERIFGLIIRGDKVSEISPLDPKHERRVMTSQEYLNYSLGKKMRLTPKVNYEPVIPKSEKVANELDERETFLEQQESTNLDEAFIYVGTKSR